jgi:hypothetical protein
MRHRARRREVFCFGQRFRLRERAVNGWRTAIQLRTGTAGERFDRRAIGRSAHLFAGLFHHVKFAAGGLDPSRPKQCDTEVSTHSHGHPVSI